jgi:hypothetical protein
MQEIKRLAPQDLKVRASKTGRIGTVVAAAVVAAVLALWSSPYGFAQVTPPLPAPGTPPANTNPDAPAAPGVPGDEAKARAAAMAAKANIDVTDAWTRATAANATTANIYLHLVSAKDPDRLIGLEVSNAARVDVREPTDQGAAKGNVSFARCPPGRHRELRTRQPLSAAFRVEGAVERRRELSADDEVRQRRHADRRGEGAERQRQRATAEYGRAYWRYDGRRYSALAS